MRLAFITVATIAFRTADVDADFLACYASIFLPQICMFLKKPSFYQTRELSGYGQRTSGGMLIKMASILPLVFKPNNVPRS